MVLHALKPFGLLRLMPYAYLAVDFFFMLSGFVLAFAYQQRLLTNLNLREFLKIRVIRLYPLALFGLLLSFAVLLAKDANSHKAITSSAWLALSCGALLLPTPLEIGHGWETAFPLDPPMWSLFWEFAVNILYALVARKLNSRALTVLVTISAAALIAQDYFIGGIGGGNMWPGFYTGIARVLFPFFCGVLLFRLHKQIRIKPPRGTSWLLGLALTALFLLQTPPLQNQVFEAVVVLLLFPAVIFVGASHEPSPRTRPALLTLGRISYPLYILHWPVLKVFSNYFFSHHLNGAALYAGICLEALAAAIFSYFIMICFDEPVRRWLNRAVAPPKPVSSAPVAAAVS
jgi:peptidoglycan/LPS O-acetylase OafA/YrhL